MPVKTNWKIKFTCGHIETKDLSHKKPHDRAGFAKWLSTHGSCTPCWRAENGHSEDWIEDKQQWLKTKRAEHQQAAENWATETGMPPLVGSQKAVDWAMRVRFDLMRSLYEWAVQDGNSDVENYDLAEESARRLDNAHWWLDNRTQDDDATSTSDLTEPELLLELLMSAADSGDGVECENNF